MTNPNNLEGTRTPEELAENFRELNRIAPTPDDKFRLMLGHTKETMNDLPANLPPLPPKERLREIRNVPLQEGDLAVDCSNPGVFLRVHPNAIGKSANHSDFSYFREIEAVRDEPATLKEAVDQWHAEKDQHAKELALKLTEGFMKRGLYEGFDPPPMSKPASGTEWTGKLWVTPGNKPAIAWIESDMVSPDGMAAAGFRLIVAKEVSESATSTEARAREDALAPFRKVARGIPDNWPGDCILRFDQREDGTIFLAYHGVNDASGGITIDQWRALLDEARTKGREGWQPIESAPRDGTEIIVYCPPAHGLLSMVSFCAWHNEAGFCVDEIREPSHWIAQPPEGGKP